MESAVSLWFGPGFQRLHPLLQELHLRGGVLTGPVEIRIGKGLARPLACALARKLGVPSGSGPHALSVEIGHQPHCLLWNRRFDNGGRMDSTFWPFGAWPDGLWLEETGPFRMGLAVEVIDGGWYWRCRKVWLHGIRLPLMLFPQSSAYKRIEHGRYRFQVSFKLPLLGTLLSYGGLLECVTSRSPDT
ncbi:MAG: DUF4166 domain-containing protein [Pseudoxanthomonas sp.]